MFEWVQTVQTFKVEICIYDIIMISYISIMESYLLKFRYFHIIVIWRSNRSNVQSWNMPILYNNDILDIIYGELFA